MMSDILLEPYIAFDIMLSENVTSPPDYPIQTEADKVYIGIFWT